MAYQAVHHIRLTCQAAQRSPKEQHSQVVLRVVHLVVLLVVVLHIRSAQSLKADLHIQRHSVVVVLGHQRQLVVAQAVVGHAVVVVGGTLL